jgi:hypothetical protein
MLPALSGGCQTWRSASRESLLEVANQPNIEHRALVLPGAPKLLVAIDGDTAVRIHSVDGTVGPLPSRYLHSSGEGLQITSPGAPPVQIDATGADFRVADPDATRALVLGITIPAALVLIALAVIAAGQLSQLNHPAAINWGPGSF